MRDHRRARAGRAGRRRRTSPGRAGRAGARAAGRIRSPPSLPRASPRSRSRSASSTRLDRPLERLQRDVAREAVADDDVGLAVEQVAALGVAGEVEIARGEQLVRLERELVPLLRLLADREQPDLAARRRRGSPRRRSRPCGRTGAGAPARASAFAPASISTDGPVRVGRRRRSPGGRRRGSRRTWRRPAASMAPVFPAETTASASPSPTATRRDERRVGLPAHRVGRLLVHRDRVGRLDELEAAGVEPGRPVEDGLDAVRGSGSAPATISSGARSPPGRRRQRGVTPSTEPACGAAGSRGPGTSCRSGRRDGAASADRRSGRR